MSVDKRSDGCSEPRCVRGAGHDGAHWSRRFRADGATPWGDATCFRCGRSKLTEPERFRKDARRSDGLQSECSPCQVARETDRRRADEDVMASVVEANRRRYEQAQRASLDGARNYGRVWTGAEMEQAMRTDITIAQIAAITGRSIYAVRSIRRAIRNGERVLP